MRLKRMICMMLVCALFSSTFTLPTSAAEICDSSVDSYLGNLVMPLATNSFNMSVPAKTKALANMSFPLMAGETVTIKASYAPFSASVDFGLVAPNGNYYYINITDGSIDKTIQVNENGSYTLQIRNNSNSTVNVSGFVNY